MLQIPIGIDDFRKLRELGNEYVDKSQLICELIDRRGIEVVLLPRPRRFGKSLNLSMLRCFFEKQDDDLSHLFEDLEGKLPGDKQRMVDLLRAFLSLDEERRVLYLLGRRAGLFRGMNDMREPDRLAAAEQLRQQLGATPDNVEEICAELMKRFI